MSSADPAAPPTSAVDLPVVPSFALPPSEPGVHTPRELLVDGRKLLDKPLTVTGYVTWIYNCGAAIRKPKETAAHVQQRIEQDPSQCERPKFYLGSTPDAPEDQVLWVVDVPRPPFKLEKLRLPKDQLAAWPAVPKLAVGDYVAVTGMFQLRSPHDERNSDGLLVYSAVEPATWKPPPASGPPVLRTRPAIPDPAIKPRVPTRLDIADVQRSAPHVSTGNLAAAQHHYDVAIAEYQQAIAAWPENYYAYYGLATIYASTQAWKQATDAATQAIQIVRDKAPPYLLRGIALYEDAVAEARASEARKTGHAVGDVAPDLSAVSFDDALASLAYAAKLDPQLWRAHYYLGRICRDQHEARWAAEEFDLALRSGATSPAPWIALVELYRRWAYDDQAVAVAQRGAMIALDGADPDLWFELGMTYDAVHNSASAIEAFTTALTYDPDHRKAHFQRAFLYFRTGAFTKARADLIAFLTGPRSADAFTDSMVNAMLDRIAALP